MDVGEMLPPVGGAAWAGRVSGTATLQGPLVRPRLQARLTSPRLFLGDEGVGALEADLRGSGDGSVSLTAQCRSPRVDMTLAGSLGASAPYDASMEVSGRRTSVDPFLRAAYPDLPESIGLVASGRMRVDGPLATPRDLRLEGALSSLEVLLPDTEP